MLSATNKYPGIFFILLLIITSCKKSNDDTEPSYNYDYAHSYLPLKTGNTWTYIRNGNDTVTLTADGSTFEQGLQEFHSVSGAVNDGAYYSQNSNLYSMMIYPSNGIAFGGSILDSSQPDGYTVTTKSPVSDPNDPAPPLSIMTINGNGFNKTINGKNYQDVIHTNVDIEEAFNGSYMSVRTYDFYFAPGIGLIEIDKSNLGIQYETLTIVNYKIQ